MKMTSKLASLTALCAVAMNFALAADTGINQVNSEDAPKAIGPYSQATKAACYIFVSGQLGIDPATGKMGDTIEQQTKQVLKNLTAILASEGLTLDNVVKTEVFLKDLKDFQVMNGLYAEAFASDVKPARATIQVSKLPMDALIEISCTAYIPNTDYPFVIRYN